MGVKLGEAFVEVYARLDRLEAGLNQAETKTKGWASGVGGFLKTALSFTVGGLLQQGINAVTGSIGGLVQGMVGGNAEFEQYQQRFEVLLKSADAAKQRLAELADFGAKTPFDLPEVVRADTILQGFGLHAEDTAKKFGFSGSEIRRIAGDVASGSGASFEQIAGYLGKFSAGATGEAIMRFQELGIVTREQLAKMGVEFDKSGTLTSPLPAAMTALLKVMNEKYNGMMAKQSKTFTGMSSNLRDWVGKTLRTVGQPIFDKLTDGLSSLLDFLDSPAVKGAIDTFSGWLKTGIDTAVNAVNSLLKTLKDSPIAKTINNIVQDIKENGLGGAISKWINNAVDTIKDPVKRQALVDSLGQGLKALADGAVTWFQINVQPVVVQLGEQFKRWVQAGWDWFAANNADLSFDLGAAIVNGITMNPQDNPFTALQTQLANQLREAIQGIFSSDVASAAVSGFFDQLFISLNAGMLGFIKAINEKFGLHLNTDYLESQLKALKDEYAANQKAAKDYNTESADQAPKREIGAQTEETAKLRSGWDQATAAVRAYIAEINRIPAAPPPPQSPTPPARPPGRGAPEGTAAPFRAPVSITVNAGPGGAMAVARATLTAVDILRARGAL